MPQYINYKDITLTFSVKNICNICYEPHHTKYKLNKHIDKYHRTNKYTCNICDTAHENIVEHAKQYHNQYHKQYHKFINNFVTIEKSSELYTPDLHTTIDNINKLTGIQISPYDIPVVYLFGHVL